MGPFLSFWPEPVLARTCCPTRGRMTRERWRERGVVRMANDGDSSVDIADLHVFAAEVEQRPAFGHCAHLQHSAEEDQMVAAIMDGMEPAIEGGKCTVKDRRAGIPDLKIDAIPFRMAGARENGGQFLLFFAQHI